MKETRFIEQNKEKWLESEKLLKQQTKDPEKLSTLFTQIVDDLSYSRTFYPNRSVRVYLNRVSQDFFSIIYRHQKSKPGRFKNFWLEELPQIVIHCRRPLLISLIIFSISAGIGVFSASNDPEFTATILGDSYVTMTKENIEKGDPMAVYKGQHQVEMFLGITVNNLMVAFRTYVMGVFFSIGTIAILLYNGIMVGCFQFFFVERGLFAESALTIWLHGTLEISSIIIAGGAGLTLGSGLIFPGTYTRLQAFQISAIRSLKLMLGITPIFVFAAIIESFLTRYTDVPDILRLLLILLSAAFIIGYFVIFPWVKQKKGFSEPLKETRLHPSVYETPATDQIKTNAELLKDGFSFAMKFSGKLFPWIAITTLGVTVLHFFTSAIEYDLVTLHDEFWWMTLLTGLLYGTTTTSPLHIIINASASTIILGSVIYLIQRETTETRTWSARIISIVQTFFITALIYSIIFWFRDTGLFFVIVLSIPVLIWIFTQATENVNLFTALGRTATLCSEAFGQVLGVQVLLILLALSFLLVLNTPLLYFNMEVLSWQITQDAPWGESALWIFEKWIRILAFYMLLPLLCAVASYLYFSLAEIHSAKHLRMQIEQLGSLKRPGRK